MSKVSAQTRRELVQAIKERYAGATRDEKCRILDEFVALTEYHRKHALRVLSRPRERPPAIRRSRRAVSGADDTTSTPPSASCSRNTRGRRGEGRGGRTLASATCRPCEGAPELRRNDAGAPPSRANGCGAFPAVLAESGGHAVHPGRQQDNPDHERP